MLFLAAGDNLAGFDGQRGEQIERAMADVVVRLPLRLPEIHGEDGLRSL